MYASRDGLSRYLGREAGLDLPVHIATANMDLSSDLRRAQSCERSGSRYESEGDVAISEAGSLVWIQILVDFELPMMPEECLGSAERAAQFLYSSSREAHFVRTVMRYWRFGTNLIHSCRPVQ